jgi:hypothetical protein
VAAIDEPLHELDHLRDVPGRARLEVVLSTSLLMCSGLFVLIAIKLASFDFRYDAKHLVVADVPYSEVTS